MPRLARNLLGNIFIHNMVQGINKEYIFEEDFQKQKYLQLMKKYSEKYNIFILAYCIMDNHTHTLTYSEDISNLSLFMKDTNNQYANYYNKSKERVGYVFRNRFTSKPIYNQSQLKYIHMNPVKAQITNSEEEYKFSSYNDYIRNQDFINSKIFNIVFQSEHNHIEKFKSIKYEPMNIEKNDININEIFNRFISENNLDSNKISKDSSLIKKFISYLISNEYKFTKVEIARILNMSRAELYRKLK